MNLEHLQTLRDHLARQDPSDFRMDDHSPDLDPDFQRGHVWTRDQQIAFVEFCLRGGTSGRNLYFNSPRFISQREGLVMVDGKQRLTAVLSWMRGDFPVFGDTWREDLGPLPFSDHNTSFRVHVNNLKTRAEILRWYLEMNEGGTPHTAQELERVRHLARMEAGPRPRPDLGGRSVDDFVKLMRD